MSDPSIRELLHEIGTEAEHLLSEFNNDLDLAYREATHRVIMRSAEALKVSHFEVRVLDVIEGLSPRDTEPVPTQRLATELGMDYFAIHYHLRKLERKRLVCRPRGERSGWKVA